jgi:hypothetical protein
MPSLGVVDSEAANHRHITGAISAKIHAGNSSVDDFAKIYARSQGQPAIGAIKAVVNMNVAIPSLPEASLKRE